MIKLLTLVVIVSSIGVACTREDSPRHVHEDATSESTSGAQTATNTSPAHDSTAMDPAPSEVAELRQSAGDFAARFKARLSKEKLEDELRQPSQTKRTELFASVQRAARYILILPNDNSVRKQILSTFTEAILGGCGQQSAECRYSMMFSSMPGTTTLLLAAADENASDLVRRYQILSLAYATVGSRSEPRIDIAYLETADAYESILKRNNDQNSTLKLLQHREIVDSAIGQMKKAFSSNSTKSLELLNNLEKTLNVWNFDRPRTTESQARAETVLALVASKMFARGDDVDASLSKQLKLTMQKPDSAFQELENVALPARRALGINESLPSTITTFIFDNLWLGRLTANESDILWKAYLSSLSSQKAASAVRQEAQVQLLSYARTRLLLQSKQANAVMTDFFRKPGKFVTADAFREGLRESLKGQTIWVDSRRRFEVLRQFSDRNLRSSDIDSTPIKDLDIFFASIDRNIKLLSTYPSMLVMSYHLARLGFSLKVDTWRGTFEIRAGQILDWFFEGTLDPWMPYSNDYRSLSKSEISTVFYYALEMGTLTDGGVDLEHLFKMLTEQMAGPIRAEIEKIDTGYRTSFDTNPLANDFYRWCQEIDKTPLQSSVLPMPQINLVVLQNFVMAGLPEAYSVGKMIHPTFGAGWTFFETERGTTSMRLDENLEVIRLELTPKITRLRMLEKVTEDYILRHNKSGRDVLMTAINLKIKPLESLRQRVYTRLFSLVNRTGRCGERLVQTELKAQEHVIQGLASHFRDVHSAMKAQRVKANSMPSEMTTLNRKFGFASKVSLPGLAEHEQALGFTGEDYRMSRLQGLLRITEILEEGFSDNDRKIRPRRAKGSILIPSRLRDIDSSWRSNSLRLDWNNDVDEFVTNGIQQTFDPGAGFINWSNLNLLATSAQIRIRAMAALAKAGLVETDQGQQRIEPRELVRQTLVMQKWIEVENNMWTNVLNMTGEYTRTDLAIVLDDFVWEKANRAWLGSLDYTFTQLSKDKLGEGDGSNGEAEAQRFTRRTGPLEELKQHARVARTFGEPTLKIPASTMSQLTDLYTKGLDDQMLLLAELIAEAKRLEPEKAANPALFPSWRIYTSRRSPVIPLLGPSAVEVVRSKAAEFSRQTGYKMPIVVQRALDNREVAR